MTLKFLSRETVELMTEKKEKVLKERRQLPCSSIEHLFGDV